MAAGDTQFANALQGRDLAEARRAADGSATRERAREVAQRFEGLFIQTMLKSMREATPGDSLFGSNGVKQYQGLFDRHIADDMAQGQGIGLAPMVERQILRQQGLAPEPEPGVDRDLAAYRSPPGSAASPRGGDTAATALQPAGRTAGGDAPGPGGPASPTPARPAAAREPAGSARPVRGALTDSPEAFVERLWPQASRVGAELDVEPRALIAQAALETGWGEHVLRHGDGRSSHNVFNIKAHRDWQGETVTVPTLEYRDGVPVREQATFRAYDSLDAAFDDYADFLSSHPRYTEALRAGRDAGEYVRALQDAGYATDPAYADKVERILASDRL